jgi:predicted dehydrogenase
MSDEFVSEWTNQRWQLPFDVGELRIAVAGAGKMARQHLEVCRSIKGLRLVGIANRSSNSAQELAGIFEIEKVFQDVGQMLDESRPDAVIVTVSHAATVPVSSLVLNRGIPCLIEKPAGFSVEETAALAKLAKQNGVVNMVALNRRFFSIIHHGMLAVLQQGPICSILVEAHEPISDYRSRRDFDAWLYDEWLVANTIHAIDLLRMIGGDVSSVSGFRRNVPQGGETFSAAIAFERGPLGHFVSCWDSCRGFGMKIMGHGVAAEFWPLEQGFVRYDTGRRIKLRPDPLDVDFRPGIYAQDVSFLEAVATKSAAPFPASDLRDNQKTMELIESLRDLPELAINVSSR